MLSSKIIQNKVNTLFYTIKINNIQGDLNDELAITKLPLHSTYALLLWSGTLLTQVSI